MNLLMNVRKAHRIDKYFIVCSKKRIQNELRHDDTRGRIKCRFRISSAARRFDNTAVTQQTRTIVLRTTRGRDVADHGDERALKTERSSFAVHEFRIIRMSGTCVI